MSGTTQPAAPTLAKLTITAYTDPNFTTLSTLTPNPFPVWINPASYSYARQITYDDQQAKGSDGPSLVFDKVSGETLSFDLMFDATGAIPAQAGQSYANGVSDAVNHFIAMAATVNAATGHPNYLLVGWSQLQFHGVLTTLTVDYTYFRSDGTPVRAKVSVGFSGHHSAAPAPAAKA